MTRKVFDFIVLDLGTIIHTTFWCFESIYFSFWHSTVSVFLCYLWTLDRIVGEEMANDFEVTTI